MRFVSDRCVSWDSTSTTSFCLPGRCLPVRAVRVRIEMPAIAHATVMRSGFSSVALVLAIKPSAEVLSVSARRRSGGRSRNGSTSTAVSASTALDSTTRRSSRSSYLSRHLESVSETLKGGNVSETLGLEKGMFHRRHFW